MQANDREMFTSELNRLCEVFDKRSSADLTASYWLALERMPLGGFRAVVSRAIETLERMPRPSQLWAIYRDVKSSRPRASGEVQQAESTQDDFSAFGQRCLFAYLLSAGPASRESLERLIEAKNRIVDQCRLLHQDEPVTPRHMREVLFSSFKRVHDLIQWDQIEEGRRMLCSDPRYALKFQPRPEIQPDVLRRMLTSNHASVA